MTETPVQASPAHRSSLPPLLAAVRPWQWPKNLLVLAAPAASGELFRDGVWQPALLTMVAFVAASSAIYLFNDLRDRHVDAVNPRTADRPIASGRLSPTLAMVAASVLVAVALALLLLDPIVDRRGAVAIVTAYLVLNGGYSLGLKNVPLVELMIVAAGYLLRAAIGGLATGVELSAWFLSVMSFAALYIVVVKRVSERHAADHRTVMDAYPEGLLEQVRSLALTATALTYVLWAFDTGTSTTNPWYELSVVPMLLGLLRYALVTWDDGGASPERVIATDRGLQAVGVVWLVTIAAAIYT